MKLRNNKVRIVADDFPSLLYPNDGYDPDDPENGLFRSPILLRFFKHIFTAPSSARQDLMAINKVKTRRPQAMLNDMKSVTPGSIAYAVLMFRHCISALDDWRTEDDLFKRDVFFDSIVSILIDPDDEWVQDTMKWWNNHIFGHLSKSDDEQDNGPSTVDVLRAKRVARQERQMAAQVQRARHTESARDTSPIASNRDHSQPPGMQVPAPTSPNRHHTPQRPRQQRHWESPQQGSRHQNQAYRPFDEDLPLATVDSGRDRRPHHQPPSTSPLQPHNSNIPRSVHSTDRRHHNSGQRPSSYRQTYSSPPPSSRNRERSCSPFHHAQSSPAVNRHRDYHNNRSSSPVQDYGRR